MISRNMLPTLLVLMIAFVSISCKKKSEAELQTLAQEYEQQEKFEDAFKTYEKMLKSYPESPKSEETVIRMAFISYNNLGEFDRAIELHRRVIKDYPESKFVSQSRFMIGYIYANDLKDFDNARISYSEFLEKHPDSELVDSVKWELEHLGKDVNDQLKELFSTQESNGRSKMN